MEDTTHVLVVEDQSSLQTAVQSLLETEGYTVSVAGDGKQALEAGQWMGSQIG